MDCESLQNALNSAQAQTAGLIEQANVAQAAYEVAWAALEAAATVRTNALAAKDSNQATCQGLINWLTMMNCPGYGA